MVDIVIAWRRAIKLQPVLVLLFCVVCACRCCGACGTSSDVLVGALDTHTHTHMRFMALWTLSGITRMPSVL